MALTKAQRGLIRLSEQAFVQFTGKPGAVRYLCAKGNDLEWYQRHKVLVRTFDYLGGRSATAVREMDDIRAMIVVSRDLDYSHQSTSDFNEPKGPIRTLRYKVGKKWPLSYAIPSLTVEFNLATDKVGAKTVIDDAECVIEFCSNALEVVDGDVYEKWNHGCRLVSNIEKYMKKLGIDKKNAKSFTRNFATLTYWPDKYRTKVHFATFKDELAAKRNFKAETADLLGTMCTAIENTVIEPSKVFKYD